jgi:hypothetical protein
MYESDEFADRGVTCVALTGKLQPTMSRTESAIWKFAERPGPGAHHIPSTIGKYVVFVSEPAARGHVTHVIPWESVLQVG